MSSNVGLLKLRVATPFGVAK